MAADLDGDGSTSLLYITSGNVIATDPTLKQRWAAKGLVPQDIVGVFDLAGDGTLQVVVLGGNTVTGYGQATTVVSVLSAANGSVLWSHDFGAGIQFEWLKIGVLDPTRSGLQLAVWPYAQTSATAYAFDKGVAAAYQMWQTSPAYANPLYQPEVVIGDAAGIGRGQLVIAGYGQVLSYDGKTGELLDGSNGGWDGVVDWITGPNIDGRNYGQIALVNLDGGNGLDYVEVCDGVTEHVAVIKSAASGLSLLWDKFVDYPEALRSVRTTVNGFADVDGDGNVEIVVSIYNQNNDNRWHVLVMDAIAGFSNIKLDLPDRYLRGVQDFGSTGTFQLLVSVATSQTPLDTADLEVHDFNGSSWETVWTLPASQFVLDPHAPVPTTMSPRSRNARNEILRADPLASFVVINDGKFEGYTYKAGTVAKSWSRAVDGGVLHRIGNLDGSGTPSVVYQATSGVLRVERADGTVIGQAQLGALVADPVVADLDGKGHNSVIVTAFGSVRRLDFSGNHFSEQWRVSGLGEMIWHDLLQGATAADLNGDGRMEVVFVDGFNSHSRMRAFNGAGQEVWSHVFTDLPAPTPNGLLANGTFLWTFGNFSGGPGLDVYVGANQAGYNTEVSRILSGHDGSLLASRNAGNYQERKFGPWVGIPAACDLSGNGVDSVAFLAANVTYVFTGLDMADAVFVGQDAPLPYYNTCIFVDVDKDGYMDLVLGGGFSSLNAITFAPNAIGKTLWHVDVPPASQFGLLPGIADVDNDGKLEIGVLRTDGIFECREAASGTVKWTHDIGSTGSSVITVDADGDGRPEFIFGTDDGRVICLQSGEAQRVLWTVDIGSPLGDVIAADVNDDGSSELLVMASDGNLYLIGSN